MREGEEENEVRRGKKGGKKKKRKKKDNEEIRKGHGRIKTESVRDAEVILIDYYLGQK